MSTARFCTVCASPLNGQEICACGTRATPAGPKILVACFIRCGDKLLFMKRNNEPRKGYWAIPAGFMESGESLREAAARELYEETRVQICADDLQFYMAGSISYISEVYVAFRGEVAAPCGECGPEAQDIGWFSADELDWDNIAYPSVNHSVETAFREAASGEFAQYQSAYSQTLSRFEPVYAAGFPRGVR